MKKQFGSFKDIVLSEVRADMDPIFNASKNAKDTVYINGQGQTVTEHPGIYCSYMTRSMSRDMLTLSMILNKYDNNISDKVKSLSFKILENDIILRRMFDDRKDKRPLSDYPFDESEDMIKTLTTVDGIDYLKNGTDPSLTQSKDKIKSWVKRILYMDIMAYHIKNHETMELAANQSDTRVFDQDGNLVYGLSEKDGEIIKTMVSLSKILSKNLVRIPVGTDESKKCLDNIEILSGFITLIIKNSEAA